MDKPVYRNTLSLLRSCCSEFKEEGRRIFATSSFQTQSLPLLHIISNNFKNDIKIIFLDTGFLFAETYEYVEYVKSVFDIDIITLSSNTSKHQQIDSASDLFLYSINPDKCCYMNKVEPLENHWRPKDVWISGVRKDQSAVRNNMDVIEKRANNILKVHPMLEWTSKDIYKYIKVHNLQSHPLEKKGYMSIGCVPCTHKWSLEDQRGGRWLGQQKTECGLHTKQNK